jgi:Phospholipase_D-nuclease N-terminal
MLRLSAAFLLFVIEAWALVQVLESPVPRSRKLRWCAAIVLLPVLGVVLWLRKGPRPLAGARHTV